MTRRRPRVLLISGGGFGFIDGVAHYTSRLAQELAAHRPEWDWMWMGRRRGFWSSPYRKQGRVQIVQPSHSWFPPHDRLARTAIRFLQPSIVHIQDQIHSFLETGAATDIAKSAACPVAVTLHEYHNELPSVRHTAELARHADFLAANDTRTAERSATFAGRKVDQIWWSPANVDPSPGFEVERVKGLCVTFGLLSSIKNLKTVYDALRVVRGEVPNLRWRIVGPFDPRNVPIHSQFASDFNEDWIEFTGSRDDPHDPILQRWLGEADVFVLPFADGASPRRTSLQTGWAFGLPIVTSPPPCAEPSIVENENCLFSPANDATAWADKVRSVLCDAELASRLRAGSRVAAERFSWSRLVARHLAEYDQLLHVRRGI